VIPSRARIIPRSEAGAARPYAAELAPTRAQVGRATLAVGRAQLMPKLVADAQTRARELIQRAHEEAQHIVSQARAAADDLILQQQARARADALCLVVGEALELRKRQEELGKSVLDRSIGFAQLLAERLLGAELELDPERIRLLARQALKEAAGARQAVIIAHPRDAAELKTGLFGLSGMLDSIGIEEDGKLGRGQLRVETELGVIEADLKGQLERLAVQLKKLLESHASERV
jgi:flagellar biosynthesis/type III secretory pathway protein FliH